MNIPIFINNRDRLTMPRKLAEQCTRLEDVSEVIIIDNDSTYPPLLEWYDKCPYKVIRLKENVGPHGLWRVGSPKSYFVTTDCDLDISRVPRGVLRILKEALDWYPEILKVGLSLEIEDIPDEYPLKNLVLHHETDKWQPFLKDHRFYLAGVDTTFALYRPQSGWGGYMPALRTRRPYTARHLPWYIVEEDEEETYYLKHLSPQGICYSGVLNEKYRDASTTV